MRKQFEIYYCKNNQDGSKAGKLYKPRADCMLAMNNQGIFFEYNGMPYYSFITKLSDKIGNYDVVWKD